MPVEGKPDPKDTTAGEGKDSKTTDAGADAAGNGKPGGDTSLLADQGGSPKDGKPKDGVEEPGNAGDGKPGESKDQEPGKSTVPEKYEFKLPEGYVTDEKLVEGATPVFKDLGLSQDQAQKLVDFWVKQEQARIEDFSRIRQEWAEKAKKDPELTKREGGFEKALEMAKAPIALYKNPAFAEMLQLTGADNHPEMIRFLVWVQEKLGEDRAAGTAGASGAGAPSREDQLRQRYPSMYPEEGAGG